MSYGLVQTVAPTAEPVTATEVKPWLRIDSGDTSQDAVLTPLISAARTYCENQTGRQFCTATWKLTLDRFPIGGTPAIWQQYSFGYWQQRIPQVALASQWWPDKASIRVPKPPLVSVSSITYVDASGVTQTLATSQYLVDTAQQLGRITPSYGNIWPIIRQQLGAVAVTFVAGYGADGTASTFPAAIKLAMYTHIAGAYYAREGIEPSTLEAVDRILDEIRTGEYT